MEVTHTTSRFQFEKDGKSAWLFSDSDLSTAMLYDIGTELRGWALSKMQEVIKTEEKQAEKAEEKKECDACECVVEEVKE